MNLFGFTLGKKEESGKDKDKELLPSVITKDEHDGSIEVGGGQYGTFIDLSGKLAGNEGQLITKYREMAMQPECDEAIQDICNEAIIIDEEEGPVSIVLENVDDISESLKKKIRTEFESVLSLLKFNKEGYDVFRKWYVDGRLYHHLVIDPENPNLGIRDIRYVDPRKIRKIKQVKKEKEPRTGAEIVTDVEEYYIFNPKGLLHTDSPAQFRHSSQGVKIATDSISYVHSGLTQDTGSKMILSHLHKAIKPLNQLGWMEDSMVIYRISRAPERRIFYIDVGNLPKAKAEQYLRNMMVKHKNKLVYDAHTGEIRDDRRYQTMLEDFWFPRREGGRGTEVTTLPGGANLGEMDDVEYFKKKLYKALNVPISRLESEQSFNVGRPSEISRDEVKFAKFIKRLRVRFSELFNSILRIQLSLKGIMSKKEFDEIAYFIEYDFEEDNHFIELKKNELMQGRMDILNQLDAFVGKYYSKQWVMTNLLNLTEKEQEEMLKQIEEEGSDDDYDEARESELGLNQEPPQQGAPKEEPYEAPVAKQEKPDKAPQANNSSAEAKTQKTAEEEYSDFLKVNLNEEKLELIEIEKQLLQSMTDFMGRQ